MKPAEPALRGVRVIDLTHYLSGPYCTLLMAGMGAEVVKVEPPWGDPARQLGPFPGDIPHPEKSGTFLWLNGGKKGITLNLKTPEGRERLLKLVKDADILVENFSPQVMPSLGLDYPRLREANPGLVMTSISNFGQTGPYRDYKATELTLYALSGLMFITGDPDQEPLKVGAPMAQFLAGQVAYVATLAALFRSRLGGQGEHIDISIMEHGATDLEFQMMEYRYKGAVLQRIGHANDKGHPHGIFPCRDGWVAIAATDDRWESFAKLVGAPELLRPDLATAQLRIRHRDEIDAFLLPWTLERGKEEVFHTLQEKRIVSGWVRDTAEVANCPQLNARGYFEEVAHPVAGKLRYPGAPFKLSLNPWQRGRAPLLGEHNVIVFGNGV